MPFADGEFDCVVANDSLHRCDEPLPVVEGTRQLLQPGVRRSGTDL